MDRAVRAVRVRIAVDEIERMYFGTAEAGEPAWLAVTVTEFVYTSGNWQPDKTVSREALDRARTVVDSAAAADHLAAYYAIDSNYAGTTFVDLEPNEPDSIAAADLLAVTTLSVEIKPHAIRTFERANGEITDKLSALDVDLRLEAVDPSVVADAMATLYDLVKRSLRGPSAQTSNAWVTASKICARKRPNLFPVRDNVVLDLLRLPKTYPVDWPAFQTLVADQALMSALDDRVTEAAGRAGVSVLDPSQRLRHLDVVLWMHAVTVIR